MQGGDGRGHELEDLLAGPYVVMDTETTGLNGPELVSIAVIDNQGRTLVDEIVRPAKPIEPGASVVSGFTDELVAQHPEFPTIARSVSEVLEGKTVVIYNADYDLAVLRNTYSRYGLRLPTFRPWCAMKWFARVRGEWDSRRGSYRWQSLAKAAASCGLEQSSPHTALADSLTTWRILQAVAGQPIDP